MKHEEDRIQYSAVMWLQSEGYYFYSVPNEGAGGNRVRMAILISLGLRKGAADLVVLLSGGRSVYFEFKSAIGTQKPGQVLFQKKLEALGHEYHLVRTLEEVQAILKDRG